MNQLVDVRFVSCDIAAGNLEPMAWVPVDEIQRLWESDELFPRARGMTELGIIGLAGYKRGSVDDLQTFGARAN